MNIDFQAQQVFDQMKQFETERAALVVQSKYYNHLKRYIEQSRDNIDEIIVPSSMGIDDPMITQLISELVNYILKRQILIKTTPKNPLVVAIDMKINNVKTTCLKILQILSVFPRLL